MAARCVCQCVAPPAWHHQHFCLTWCALQHVATIRHSCMHKATGSMASNHGHCHTVGHNYLHDKSSKVVWRATAWSAGLWLCRWRCARAWHATRPESSASLLASWRRREAALSCWWRPRWAAAWLLTPCWKPTDTMAAAGMHGSMHACMCRSAYRALLDTDSAC
jgi:hypothetical protein